MSVREWLLPATPTIPDHRKGGMRPVWRGRLHAVAFIVAVPALVWLIAVTPAGYRWPEIVYAVSLLAVLGVSASYHILTKTPTSQVVMSRVDRAMIYALIAGTYTPIVVWLVPSPWSGILLAAVWVGAVAGIVFRSMGILPRTSIGLYIGLGWVAILTAPVLWQASIPALLLVVAGGVFYTVGAVFYASKRPALSPTHFGYHELFHAFTVGGFACHYAAILTLAVSLPA